MPRTTESLQQIIHGLYPPDERHPTAVPVILIRYDINVLKLLLFYN